MKTTWEDNLEVGIEIIDTQHRQIFNRTDKFLELVNNNPQEKELQQEVEDLFYFLTDYVITHFETEEELQQEYDYSDYERHQQLHQNFRDKITNFKLEYLQEAKEITEVAEQKYLCKNLLYSPNIPSQNSLIWFTVYHLYVTIFMSAMINK